MDVRVSARHVEVSDRLREATVEKIGRLERFLPGMERAEVHFFEERNPRISDKDICEVTLEGHGHHVRTKVAAPDCFAAVDGAVDKLEHQLHKLKTKLYRRSGRKGGARANERPTPDLTAPIPGEGATIVDDAFDGVATDDAKPVVKRKQFVLRPMTVDEAVLLMDLLDHDFYVFKDAEDGQVGVLYARDDGNLGLIKEQLEP